jgi:putative ABC transport system substrate-binding protein
MKRRAFLLALLLPLAAVAQPAKRRVAILLASNPDAAGHLLTAFKVRMAELGWSEGRNIEYALRFGGMQAERYPAIAAEAIELNADVIFAPFVAVALEVKRRTSRIPIVFAIVSDPVSVGLVETLAKPGGNATGVTTRSTGLMAKRMQLIKEAFPRSKGIGVLFNRASGGSTEVAETIQQMSAAAKPLGLELLVQFLDPHASFEAALARLKRDGADAMLVDLAWYQRRRELVQAVGRERMPAVYSASEYTDDGGLMTLAVSTDERYREAARYVDRILRGAKPHDLAVEEPTRLDLVVNLKTARALGMQVPQSILVRADRVIE